MPHAHANPFLHQNKPPRESIFCGKVSDWWTTRALIMLNFSLKTRQNKFEVNNREWTTARKTCTLAMASANSCRAYCSRATGTAAWKGRRNRPLTSGFLLVESALNNSRLITFCDIATFCHRQMGPNFGFHRIFVQYFVHGRDVYLGITAQRHKLRSICRNTKSQDYFNKSTSRQVGGRSHLFPFKS